MRHLAQEPPTAASRPKSSNSGAGTAARPGLFDPEILKTAFCQSLVMLRPDIQWKNPVMFVVEVGTVLTARLHRCQALRVCKSPAAPVTCWPWTSGWWRRCCSPTSPRRLPRPAARPRPTPCGRRGRPPRPGGCKHDGAVEETRLHGTRARRSGGDRRRRGHPQRRRDHRGRGLDRRIGHHRRIGPRDPRGGRRPLGRDRRHAGPFRPDRGADHRRRRAARSSIA